MATERQCSYALLGWDPESMTTWSNFPPRSHHQTWRLTGGRTVSCWYWACWKPQPYRSCSADIAAWITLYCRLLQQSAESPRLCFRHHFYYPRHVNDVKCLRNFLVNDGRNTAATASFRETGFVDRRVGNGGPRNCSELFIAEPGAKVDCS